MAATVLSAPPSLSFQPCPHCHEADHRGPDCALASVDPYSDFKPITPRPKPYTRPPPADAASIEICRRFNRGICTAPSRCKYRHICAIPTCLKPGHSALACPLRQDLSRPRPGPPPQDEQLQYPRHAAHLRHDPPNHGSCALIYLFHYLSHI